jgi:hypothetical protein
MGSRAAGHQAALVAVLGCALLSGCGGPSGASQAIPDGGSNERRTGAGGSGVAADAGAVPSDGSAGTGQPDLSLDPQDSGAASPDLAQPEPPPHPTSTRCGDGIRDPVTEECDEAAAGAADPCTADCRVRAVPVAQAMQLGTAPHVAGGTDSGFAIAYSGPDASPAVELQLFGESGARLGSPVDVAGDYAPVPAANAAVAALPDGRYAVAWTDGMEGPPEVRLRLVDGRTLGAARLAHEDAAGLHADPDLLWAGDRLVVAFTDLLDVTYREFSSDLVPLGPEAPLAATAAIESGVALARFGSGWAGAVRSSSDALESIVVRSGDLIWSTPPAPPGPTGDRPALAALDDAHLLVLFSVGADPDGTGAADVGRLFWAVADAAAPGPLAVRALDVGAAPASSVSQRRPTATRAGDRVYLGWTETDDAGARGEQVFLAPVALDAAAGAAIGTPMPLPRGTASAGWRRNLRLAASSLFPAGAVISTWESASDGSSLAAVDLVLDFRPSPFVFLD